MANVIDSLVVLLGLDASGYKKGQQEVSDSQRKFTDEQRRQAKEMQERTKAVQEGFRAIRNEILAVVSTALGGKALKDFLADATAANRQLGFNARNLSMSAGQLKAWQAAAQAAGGTADGFTDSLKGVAAAIENWRQGNPNEQTQMLARLGVNFDEKDYEKLLLDIASKLPKLPPQTQLYVARGLGIDEGTLRLLLRGKEGVQELVAQMSEHTKHTQEATEAAERLGEAWGRMANRLGDLRDRIYSEFAPAAEKLVELLNRVLDFILKADDATDGWVVRIGAITAGIVGLVGAIRTLKTVFDGAKALLGGGGGAAAGGAAAGAASGGFRKLLARILGPVGVALLAHEGIALVDPNDSIGNWINENIPGAASVNNWFARNLGIGSVSGGGGGGSSSSQSAGETGKLFDSLEKKFGLPEGMLDKVWNIESGRGKNMVSAAGATGHFQMMPGTAKDLGLSREDTFDLNKSAEAAARYLSGLLKQNGGDVTKALAAYNWGMGNLQRQGLQNAPQETLDYIRKYNSMGGSKDAGSRVETSIQNLNVNLPNVQDAKGFARELPGAMSSNSLVPAFVQGVS